NRGFHQRAAEFIAAQGIRQFIDIGSGLPATGNTHEVVLKVAPDARVVYVDHDPMVAAMAEGLIADPESARLIEADVREPDVLLSHPVLAEMIDFSLPVGLHFVADGSNPKGPLRLRTHRPHPQNRLVRTADHAS
ncbi:MAG TPA: SAM-dependent methyltransferase, partial [Streptosporangiaceae bacterium]